eukprot:scaffold246_cov181-Ochromonas_danica.AAC.5
MVYLYYLFKCHLRELVFLERSTVLSSGLQWSVLRQVFYLFQMAPELVQPGNIVLQIEAATEKVA